jgi:hypothetical protein
VPQLDSQLDEVAVKLQVNFNQVGVEKVLKCKSGTRARLALRFDPTAIRANNRFLMQIGPSQGIRGKNHAFRSQNIVFSQLKEWS